MEPEIVQMLVKKDERIKALEEENKRLRETLMAAKDHLEWIGYGDNYERECAFDAGLPKRIKETLNPNQ